MHGPCHTRHDKIIQQIIYRIDERYTRHQEQRTGNKRIPVQATRKELRSPGQHGRHKRRNGDPRIDIEPIAGAQTPDKESQCCAESRQEKVLPAATE